MSSGSEFRKITAKGNGKVLLNGLGGGYGSMWTEEDRYREHKDYADAPIDPSRRDGFGDNAYGHSAFFSH